MEKLSAVIITFNEADRIERCVRAVSFCDDVLVVDAHSTDRTLEVARAAGARVIERDWPGYRSQKDFAVKAAAHDWVLCLDADEVVTPELRAEIEALRATNFSRHAGWEFGISLEYFGKTLRHGAAFPNRHTRLIDRRRGGWLGEEIHEYLAVTGTVGRLRGHANHYAYRSLSHQVSKLEKYAELMARAMHAKGKRVGLAIGLFKAFWRFFSGYVLRLGFLDGWRGLVFSLVEGNYTRQKYLKLFLLQRGYPI